MTALLAITGTDSVADCFGLLETADWTTIDFTDPDPVQIAQRHLCTLINTIDANGGAEEVSFDDSDILGTYPVSGDYDNLIVGIWLSTSPTVTGSLGNDEGRLGASVGDPPNFDVTPYVIPDLRPADNAYMFQRGFVTPPGQRRHAYP